MKNFIFGTGYHGRQIFRKLYERKKLLDFLIIIKDLKQKKLFEKNLPHK